MTKHLIRSIPSTKTVQPGQKLKKTQKQVFSTCFVKTTKNAKKIKICGSLKKASNEASKVKNQQIELENQNRSLMRIKCNEMLLPQLAAAAEKRDVQRNHFTIVTNFGQDRDLNQEHPADYPRRAFIRRDHVNFGHQRSVNKLVTI